MDKWNKETTSLYKRLICYHCFQENKTPKAASLHLNKTYGKSFLTEGAIKKWYATFREKDQLDFNEFVKLQWAFRRPRRKPIPADPPPLDDGFVQELAESEAKAAEEKGAVKNKRAATNTNTPSTLPSTAIEKASGSLSDGDLGTGADGLLDGNLASTTTNLDRCEKRKLILRCYKAKFSVGEANRYLNSIHGQGFINKTSVYTWYRRFEQKDFKLGDKNRSGRPQKVDDAKGKEVSRTCDRK